MQRVVQLKRGCPTLSFCKLTEVKSICQFIINFMFHTTNRSCFVTMPSKHRITLVYGVVSCNCGYVLLLTVLTSHFPLFPLSSFHNTLKGKFLLFCCINFLLETDNATGNYQFYSEAAAVSLLYS